MADTPPTLGVGITTDIGAVANAVKEGETIVDDTIKALNTPQETQGRLNVAEQKIKDKNASDVDSAIKTGDNTKMDEDLS